MQELEEHYTSFIVTRNIQQAALVSDHTGSSYVEGARSRVGSVNTPVRRDALLLRPYGDVGLGHGKLRLVSRPATFGPACPTEF